MFYDVALYISLAIFGIGLIYKVSTWFRYTIGTDAADISTSARVLAALKGIMLTLLSSKILDLLKVFVLDVLLQIKVLRQDRLRWAMHMCIYLGFMLLLLMHALDNIITAALFEDYSSTVNPYLFLRELSGVVIVLGVAIAVYRRFILKVPRHITSAMDIYAIIILAVIMISGFFLEGTKITSYTRYQDMVEEYTIEADEEELRALESYWVAKFGVVSPNLKGPFDAETLEMGEEAHDACVDCHSRPQWGFAGYAVAKITKPVALGLDKADVSTILWYLHFLACFIGLAYLPFSKFFHMFTSPLSLLANAVMDPEKSDPANIATRQVLELDACMHCGTCSVQCRVGVIFQEIPNFNILPSEKIPSIKALAAGKKISSQEIRTIQEGMYLCTNCYNCTVACPAGINLQDLWFNVRESLFQKGIPEFLMLSPFSVYRGLMKETLDQAQYPVPINRTLESVAGNGDLLALQDRTLPLEPGDHSLLSSLNLAVQSSTFSHCFRCVTCSNACPVVTNYSNPQEVVGLLPHQIMHATGMRLWDLVFSAKMLWDCLGCYQCQEHCPQGVCVADVLYELKNVAITRAIEKMST
jgi:heterodisulfide reductase subunit C/nitrate reductase gamma subunit